MSLQKLEATQLNTWVEQLEVENQLLRTHLLDSEDTLLGEGTQRKGLTVFMELERSEGNVTTVQLRQSAQRVLQGRSNGMCQSKVQPFLNSILPKEGFWF